MYTWGYIKESTISKLDMTVEEAVKVGHVNKFPFAANEAMTQICSSIKPKHTFAEFVISNPLTVWNELVSKYNVYELNNIICKPNDLNELSDDAINFWKEYDTYMFPMTVYTMPKDFIMFGNDINTIITKVFDISNWKTIQREATEQDFRIYGTDKIMFYTLGVYHISYNARWFTFEPKMDGNTELDVPLDILDCIPSYIASQCYKVDDEVKSAIYRNEYELFLSRIIDGNFETNKTIHISGGW